MSRITLQKPNGQIRCFIETIPHSGRKQIQLPSGQCMGFYTPQTDTTHNMDGSLVCRGDMLTSLVP
jgi:hypothetical protein